MEAIFISTHLITGCCSIIVIHSLLDQNKDYKQTGIKSADKWSLLSIKMFMAKYLMRARRESYRFNKLK